MNVEPKAVEQFCDMCLREMSESKVLMTILIAIESTMLILLGFDRRSGKGRLKHRLAEQACRRDSESGG